MDLVAAIAFVEQHGAPIEQVRLAYLLDHIEPPAGLVTALFADQRADGGWAPFWAPNYSALDATCFRLAQAEPLGLVPSTPESQRALEWLQTQIDHLEGSELAWALTSLRLAGVPQDHRFVGSAMQRLERLQRSNGSWASADGSRYDVHVTLEALRALVRGTR